MKKVDMILVEETNTELVLTGMNGEPIEINLYLHDQNSLVTLLAVTHAIVFDEDKPVTLKREGYIFTTPNLGAMRSIVNYNLLGTCYVNIETVQYDSIIMNAIMIPQTDTFMKEDNIQVTDDERIAFILSQINDDYFIKHNMYCDLIIDGVETKVTFPCYENTPENVDKFYAMLDDFENEITYDEKQFLYIQ